MNKKLSQTLVINIGNSRVGFGLFQNAVLTKNWYLPSNDTVHVIQEISNLDDVANVYISSVVPKISQLMKDELVKQNQNHTEITSNTVKILSNHYETLGADRIANAVAGFKLYGNQSKNIIVIDAGTATTLTAVSDAGKFLGGYITLGLQNALNDISEKTAQLPQVSMANLFKQQENIFKLGSNTNEAIERGTFLAQVGLIEYWIKIAKKELKSSCITVATGGLSRYIFQVSGHIDICDPTLTLKGIYLCGQAKDLEDQG
jgi:type III pantothenate kinase